jgi:predicted alpha-1,6-mannanase (GH76 family)
VLVPPGTEPTEPSQPAEQARRVLVEQYWDEGLGLMRTLPGPAAPVRRRMRRGAWHYWWQAWALQALLDGVQAGDGEGRRLVPALVAGVAARSGGDLTSNRYVDDLAWMGLATLRAHRLGLVGPQAPLALAAAVLRGHDPELGGFRWRFGGGYLNVAATAPAAMLLAGTADLARDPSRLKLARASAEWLHEHLVDPTGLVLDGCRVVDGVLVASSQVWSYTIGGVVALDVTLAGHDAPGSAERRLARAASVLRVGLAQITGPDEVWRDEGGPGPDQDAALFRGILARFVADAAVVVPEPCDLVAALHHQADAVQRSRDSRGRVRATWSGAGSAAPRARPARLIRPARPTLAAHLAGTLTLAAAARLPR